MKRSAALFVVVPIANGLSSLLALPAVTAQTGEAGWAAIAIGFSLGSAGAILVELGWGVEGPLRVGRASTRSRHTTYVWSVRLRLALFPIVGLVSAALAWGLSPAFRGEASLMAVAMTAVGLSPAWYFTGLRKPQLLLITDSSPRLIGTVLAATLLTVGWPLWVYPALLLGAGLIAPALAASADRISFRAAPRLGARRFLRLAIIQTVALRGRLATSIVRTAPVILVSVFAPLALPVFAAAERLQKMALQLLNSASLFFTSWVGASTDRTVRLRRSTHAIKLSGLVGVVAGGAFAALCPWVASIVFSGTVDVDPLLSGFAGAVIALVCISRAMVTRLIVLQRTRSYSNAAVTNAAVGSAAIAGLAAIAGPTGAMIGELAGELAGLGHQILSARGGSRPEPS